MSERTVQQNCAEHLRPIYTVVQYLVSRRTQRPGPPGAGTHLHTAKPSSPHVARCKPISPSGQVSSSQRGRVSQYSANSSELRPPFIIAGARSPPVLSASAAAVFGRCAEPPAEPSDWAELAEPSVEC
jgi:hypothetical protein